MGYLNGTSVCSEEFLYNLEETAKIKGGRVQDQNLSSNLRMIQPRKARANVSGLPLSTGEIQIMAM